VATSARRRTHRDRCRQQHGARRWHDIDPARTTEANENARKAGVQSRVRFMQGDIFDPAVPIKDAPSSCVPFYPT
jgi:23S rRNA G2445 N2-methylase RlmL